jgi:hypothetical protein
VRELLSARVLWSSTMPPIEWQSLAIGLENWQGLTIDAFRSEQDRKLSNMPLGKLDLEITFGMSTGEAMNVSA